MAHLSLLNQIDNVQTALAVTSGSWLPLAIPRIPLAEFIKVEIAPHVKKKP
jgi:hypothetical protein